MKTGKLILLSLLMSCSFAAKAAETGWHYNATLTGLNETPPILSSGKGSFSSKVDRSGTMLEYTLTFSELANVTVAHIHFGHKHGAGAPIAFLCGGGTKPACPVFGGTVSGTISAADVIGVPAQGINEGSFSDFLAVLKSGDTYVNVHTAAHPGGEIRGQVQ